MFFDTIAMCICIETFTRGVMISCSWNASFFYEKIPPSGRIGGIKQVVGREDESRPVNLGVMRSDREGFRSRLEVDFCAVISTGQKLFHGNGINRSGIGAGAGVTHGEFCNAGEFFFKLRFLNAEFL